MEDDKREYEISFLLSGPEAKSEVLNLLNQIKAELTAEEEPRLINLAYPIKKQLSAHFGFYQFRANPADLKSLKDALAINAKVLRFLVVSDPIKKQSAVPKERPRPEIPSKPAPIESMPTPKVLSNEALEKTLEEILQ